MLSDLEACDIVVAKMKQLHGKKTDDRPLPYKIDRNNKAVAEINEKLIKFVIRLGNEIAARGIDKKLTKDQVLKIIEIAKLAKEEEAVIKQQRQFS